jgi:hypothetical protein
MLSAADGELRGNTWHAACEGYNVDSSSRLFMADNTVVAIGDKYSEGNGFSHFSWPQVTEHIYVGNTTQVGNPAATTRQETMSFDGAAATYFGPHAGVEGAQLTIPANPVQKDQNYSGLLVHISSGAGTGQMRRVLSWRHTRKSSTWTLDAPLSTPLDEASYVSIGAYSGRVTFEGNRFVNGTQFQLFGTSTHVMIAGNDFVNVTDGMHEIGGCWTGLGCGGVLVWGYSGGNFPCHHDSSGHFPCAPTSWTVEPAFHVTTLNNSLVCSKQLSSIGPDYNGPPLLTGGPRSLGHVHRGNALEGNTDLTVNSATWSVVLEANALRPGKCDGAAAPAGTIIINATSTKAVLVTPNATRPASSSSATLSGNAAMTSTIGNARKDKDGKGKFPTGKNNSNFATPDPLLLL